MKSRFTPLARSGLDAATIQSLEQLGCHAVNDLETISEDSLRSSSLFTEKQLEYIAETVARFGVAIGSASSDGIKDEDITPELFLHDDDDATSTDALDEKDSSVSEDSGSLDDPLRSMALENSNHRGIDKAIPSSSSTLVKCVHCAGTGECHHCGMYYKHRRAPRDYSHFIMWYECQLCGSGPELEYKSNHKNDSPGDDAPLPRRPQCVPCNYSGWRRI